MYDRCTEMDRKMNNARSPRLSYFLLALIPTLALCVATVDAKPTAPPDFEEDWFVVTLQGQSCGYMHAILRRAGNEVHSESKIMLEIRRGAAVVKIVVDQSFRETLAGDPIGFKHVTSLGMVPETLTGTIKDGRVKLVTEQFGVKHEESYPFDPEIKFAWGQLMAQREHGLEPGTTFTLKAYEPSLKKDGPLEVDFTVHEKETIEVLGQDRKLTRLSSSMNLQKDGATGGITIDSDTWVDDEMNPIVMTADFGIMQFKMYKTTKADALKRGAPPEMFLTTMIPIDRRIGTEAKSVKLRLRLKKGAKSRLPTMPDTTMQHFERINDREAILTLRRLDWDSIRKAVDDKNDGADLSEYLRATAVCDAADSRIKRLSRRAVRGQKTPAEKADALRKFVTDYITDKNMDVGFATASEVARNRSGDCTEHGVLLAALARAAGLPARGVSGLVEVPRGYLSSDDSSSNASAFGFHMWTQVYIGGQWVGIDAAMRQTDCHPNHIAISIVPFGDEGLMNTVISLIPLLGQLEIEVLEVKP